MLLALLEHGGRLVAACLPRQCWPPPKPTKVSGNLPMESSHLPQLGFGGSPRRRVCRECQSPACPCCSERSTTLPQRGYSQVISAGLKKGEQRLYFNWPFNQEGKRGGERMTPPAILRTFHIKRQFLSSEWMLTHHLPQQTGDSFWSHCLLHGNHNLSFS